MKKYSGPPRMFQRFFRWFCRPDLRDPIEGDLLELYRERVLSKGKCTADRLFIADVLLLLRPGIIRSVQQPSFTYQNQFSMLKNYLKIAWRNIIKDKKHALLNVASLCAGLTCFYLIALWVFDELSYDRFHRHFDRIVRLTSTAITATGTQSTAMSSAPMARALQQDFNEVENTVRFKMREEIISYHGEQLLQPGILLTDPSFFEVFSYCLRRGDKVTALKEPYSLILTQSTAHKYFGDRDPMGERLLMNMYDSTNMGALYTVTGIMDDPPPNAHFTFNMLSSFKTIEVARPEILTTDGWGDASFYTYLLLKPGVDVTVFSQKIVHFYEKYTGELANIWKPIYSYHLQPLRDIHLRSTVQDEIAATGSITRVYVFSLIGIFILLLAGINYTNLATARASGRVKEISIKKVIGAEKRQLVLQFLCESVATALLALALALGLVVSLRPAFNELAGKNTSLYSYPPVLVFLIGVATILGLISGFYPAMILSSFKPANALKGLFKSGSKGILFRRILVVSQFVITVILVTGIIVINSQMSFIRNKDLGYDKDALLVIKVNGNTDVIQGYQSFKNDLQASPLIAGLTTSNSLIVGGLGSGGAATVDAKGNPLQVNTARLRVDSTYFAVYGIRLVAGRNFSRFENADNEQAVIQEILVNETAVKKFGWATAAEAIGKPFQTGNARAMIAGVVKDFHFSPLQQDIEPLAIYPSLGRFSRITLKADMRDPGQVVRLVQAAWRKHFPAALFDFDFINQQIKNQYLSEERFSTIFFYFSVLSLIIACIGLYGLISYSVSQRTKEIGIRKILGAGTGSIAAMLSTEFLVMLLLSCLLAIPVSWMVMKQWLQQFAYRTSLSWWMFAVGGILVLVIALFTVSIKALRAAMVNPVRSLRTE